MFKMVKPVGFLQIQVKHFLDEWPEHPGLQRIFDITESLLAMPLNSPLSKLWFLLRAVLRDVKDQSLFTIKSIEEFMQTSSVGEFKRRLQLALAFHGQISYGITLKTKAYSSPCTREYLNFLYNTFGYTTVSERIESGRRSIEKELKELLKLYRWVQDSGNFASIANFRRTKQKTLKSVQKFNDVLQQPPTKLLDGEVVRIESRVPSWLDQKVPDVSKVAMLPFPVDLGKLGDVEWFYFIISMHICNWVLLTY